MQNQTISNVAWLAFARKQNKHIDFVFKSCSGPDFIFALLIVQLSYYIFTF